MRADETRIRRSHRLWHAQRLVSEPQVEVRAQLVRGSPGPPAGDGDPGLRARRRDRIASQGPCLYVPLLYLSETSANGIQWPRTAIAHTSGTLALFC